MRTHVSGREAALKTLMAFTKSGAWSDSYLNSIISNEAMDERDAALARKICMGVLQNMLLLDFYIAAFCKIERLEPTVREILRLSVYQIAFLDRIPSRAAVNEAVALTKKYSNPGAAGLVNAVLRRIAENSGKLPLPEKDDILSYLSVYYSHPEELTEYAISRLGIDDTVKFLKHNNKDSPLFLRVNKLKTTEMEIKRELENLSLRFRQHEYLQNFFLLDQPGNVQNLAMFEKGYVTVQDPASWLTAIACNAKPNMKVLDSCSAPGGKSFAIAELMEGIGEIKSCDISARKLRLVADGAKRLGIGIINTEELDAKNRLDEYCGIFDLVLCDAPCSGLGAISKKPEIRYKEFAGFSGLEKAQLDIMSNISDYVKPNGTLVYSTCTIREDENEGLIRKFLKLRDDFSLEPFELPGPAASVSSGMITLWPHLHFTDGFFICKLRKC